MDELTAKQRLLMFGACFLLILLFLVILFGEKGFYDYMFLKKQYAEIKKDNDNLEEEGRKTYAIIKRLKIDLDYIEEIARQQIGMVLENEMVYQFPEDEAEKNTGKPSGTEEKK